MSTILVLIVITFQIRMFSGNENETIKMKVQKGKTVVLKCSNYEGIMTWFGPDVNNIGQIVELYFSNNDKNPKLNLTEYSLQANEGNYDLIIANFLQKNTGCYICRVENDGLFHETRYNVSLLGNENETIKMKVQKGKTVVLKCSNYEGIMTWFGPDVNNIGQIVELYFSNNDKNPKLNLTEYSLQANEGNYDLIIANFLEKNTGCYICRVENDGLFHETRYNVSLLENETTTTSLTGKIYGNISSTSMLVQTTNFQFPKSKQGNKEHNSVLLFILIPVVLIGGSLTIVGLLARVKGITIGEMLSFFLLSCRRDTERHTATDEIPEQDNTVENQLYQNSNVTPNGDSSELDADLGVSEDTGTTSNHRNTDESTAVRLHECTPGLHYAEVSIKQVTSQQIKIHGIENRTIYTGIDHSLNIGVVHSDQSDNDSEDDFFYIQNLDVNCRNYENTCL